MARKKAPVDPSIFRFMCLRDGNTNYHKDFSTKEDALQYADELNDNKIEWYGIYEISPLKDYLISVDNKRLKPYKDNIIVKSKEDDKPVRKRRMADNAQKHRKPRSK